MHTENIVEVDCRLPGSEADETDTKSSVTCVLQAANAFNDLEADLHKPA